MSWNMVIFGFGFIVGGFAVMLILGLLSLPKDMTETTEYPRTVGEPKRDDKNPDIYPRLIILSGRKDHVSLINK